MSVRYNRFKNNVNVNTVQLYVMQSDHEGNWVQEQLETDLKHSEGGKSLLNKGKRGYSR